MEQKESLSKEIDYVPFMSQFRFATADDFSVHHYKNQSSNTTRTLIKRLSTEYADLSKSMSVDVDSSAVLRVHGSKMNFAQMIIIPADGTPYSSGCFLFDIYFPPKLFIQIYINGCRT